MNNSKQALKKKNQKNFSPFAAKPRPINPVIASSAQRLRWRPCEAIQYFPCFILLPAKTLSGLKLPHASPNRSQVDKSFFGSSNHHRIEPLGAIR
jgi:hypothetical protein